jgi:hypothetical protein
VDEEATIYMVHEEFDTNSDDQLDLENEIETVNEESSNKKSENESESETSVDKWKQLTMCNEKPNAGT